MHVFASSRFTGFVQRKTRSSRNSKLLKPKQLCNSFSGEEDSFKFEHVQLLGFHDTKKNTPKTHPKIISLTNKPCKKILDSLLPLCRDAASRIHQIVAEHEQNTGKKIEKRSKLLAQNYSKFEKKLDKTAVSQQWMMLSLACKVRV